jgi:outer membrane protein
MIMKKFLLTLVFVSGILIANAQTEKGDWMVGGGFQLNTADNNTEIALFPNAGAFIINNLALGGNLQFSYSKTGGNKITVFGIGPFVRYYFTNANVRPILQGSLNYLSQTLKYTGVPSSTSSGLNYFLGGGAAIFISDQVSLDALLGYDHTKVKDFEGSGGFAMTIGFQVYLLKRQMDKVRGR